MIADPMGAASFRAAVEFLGLSQADVADRLGVSDRTVRHWLAGRYAIPVGVADEVRAWLAYAASLVERQAAEFVECDEVAVSGGSAILEVVVPTEGPWPRRFWRHVALRIAERLGVPVEVVEDVEP